MADRRRGAGGRHPRRALRAQTDTAVLIGLGVLLTLAINWMSFTFHGYQAELFPTHIRARAVGFVYAWSRLSAAFAGLLIAVLLQHGGVGGVFAFIAGAMGSSSSPSACSGRRRAVGRWRRSRPPDKPATPGATC